MTTPAAAAGIGPESPMGDVLAAYPGAQRALFRRYHIGGCSSCGFQPTETLAALCARNNGLPVADVFAHIQASHEQDEKILLTPAALAELRRQNPDLKLVDVRSREEFEAVNLPGSILLSQPVMQEIMGRWDPQAPLVLVDHLGKQAMDAAAYFAGHGFTGVRCLRGGLDAWAVEVDPAFPRYTLG